MLFAAASIGLAAAGACTTFQTEPPTVDAGTDAEADAPVESGDARTPTATFCTAEAMKAVGALHFSCSDFDSARTLEDWPDASAVGSGAAAVGKNGLSPPGSLALQISNASDAGGSVALSAGELAAPRPFRTMELRFALFVSDLNTDVSLAQLSVGGATELTLVLGPTDGIGAPLSLEARGEDGGVSAPVFLRTLPKLLWARVAIVLGRQTGVVTGIVTIDGVEVARTPSPRTLDASALGRAAVGLIELRGARKNSASVSIDDVVLRIE